MNIVEGANSARNSKIDQDGDNNAVSSDRKTNRNKSMLNNHSGGKGDSSAPLDEADFRQFKSIPAKQYDFTEAVSQTRYGHS